MTKKTAVLAVLAAVVLGGGGVAVGYFLTHKEEKPHDGGKQDPEPEQRGAKTVVLISVDTLRADHLSCYGYKAIQTPAIDKFAEESILYERCYTPYPLTLPAHTSMFTGTSPVYHKVRDNTYATVPRGIVTLAEVFSARQGTATAGFVSSAVMSRRSGIARGFQHYDDKMNGPGGGHLLPERTADETIELAMQWLKDRPAGQPVFMFIHLMDPHFPYNPPDPKFREGLKKWTQPVADQLTPWYDAEVRYTDDRLGHLFARLKDMGRWSDACIALTADHGEGLGDHGELTHGYFIHDDTTHVPLIVKPGIGDLRGRVAQNVRVPGVVELMDIFPTLCAAGGVKLSDQAKRQQQGMDLFSAAGDPRALNKREAYIESWYGYNNAGWARLRGLRGKDHFSVVVDGAAEEYRDADCKVNLLAPDAKPSASDQAVWQESRDRVSKLLTSLSGAGIRAVPRGDVGAYYDEYHDHGGGSIPGAKGGYGYPESPPDYYAESEPGGTKGGASKSANPGYPAEQFGSATGGEESLADSVGRASPHSKAAALAEYQRAEMKLTGGGVTEALEILATLISREQDMLPAYKLAGRACMTLAALNKGDEATATGYAGRAAGFMGAGSEAAARLKLDGAANELRAAQWLYLVMLDDGAVVSIIGDALKAVNPSLGARMRDRFIAIQHMAMYRALGEAPAGDADAAAKLQVNRVRMAKDLELALTHPDSCRELIADMRTGKALKLAPWER